MGLGGILLGAANPRLHCVVLVLLYCEKECQNE